MTLIISRLDDQDKTLNSLHGHVMDIEKEVKEVHIQAVKTNGRVNKQEVQIETMSAEQKTYISTVNEIKSVVKSLTWTGVCLLGVLSFVGWLLANDYMEFHLPLSQVQHLNSTK